MAEEKLHELQAMEIELARDGRTQRWLSFEIRVSEQDLSRKLNGSLEWKEQELVKIEEVLNCVITRNL